MRKRKYLILHNWIAANGEGWQKLPVQEIRGSTIGNKRILTFPAVDISTIEITILEQDGATVLSETERYYMPRI